MTIYNGARRVLKECVCVTNTKNFSVDGEDFNEEMLTLVIYNNPESNATGWNLWYNPNEVTNNVQKALTLLPKLKGKIVNMDKCSKIVGYLSGHNESNDFSYILDGICAMECKEEGKVPREEKSP